MTHYAQTLHHIAGTAFPLLWAIYDVLVIVRVEIFGEVSGGQPLFLPQIAAGMAYLGTG